MKKEQEKQPPKKPRFKSAQKGGDFERAQAKLLSMWLSEGATPDALWRTGMSGGRHTIGALKGIGYGDLQVLNPTPEAQRFIATFCVELKHYNEFELFKEWYNEKSNLKLWWNKLSREAKQNNVQPMLIVKPNLKPAMIFFEHRLFLSILRAENQSIFDKSVELKFDGYHLIGFVQSEFLDQVEFYDLRPWITRKSR